jgi:2-methylcitrate dehydratase PrpD
VSREACAQEIRRLAEWAVGTRVIPPDILARAVRVLADDLSAIIGAREEPEVQAFHKKVFAKRREEEATVFAGGRRRTDRLSAAVANAVAADWLELDEGYRVTPCHAGLYVIPALIAEAEARNLPLGELLRALVLSYEIVTRVARGWKPRAMNMQSHGRYSAVGAAAAVALARNADVETLLGALGTAVTLIGPSPRNHLAEGILSRNVWPAMGAWSGSMAVEWAESGIAGAPAAFFDVYSTILGGEAQRRALTNGLGERWALEDGYTKVYACCQHLHSAVEAAVGMREEVLRKAKLEDIAAVKIETHALALPLVNFAPATTLGAKFSMPHAIAAAFVTGTGGADAFTAATLAEPRIAQLRQRVSMAPWTADLTPPNDRPARVTVELRGGGRFAAECLSAAGGPDRPLPPSVVFDKMSALAAPVYPKMRPLFEELCTLPPARLRAGWSDLVKEFCE